MLQNLASSPIVGCCLVALAALEASGSAVPRHVRPRTACPGQSQLRETPRRLFLGTMLGGYDADQLEALLVEVGEIVHRFIVVEADHTHQGLPRHRLLPTFLSTLEDRWWIHDLQGGDVVEKVAIGWLHLDAALCQQYSWHCEVAQRNAVLSAAVEAGLTAGKDLLISGDADELPNREALQVLAWCDFGQTPTALGLTHLVYSFGWEFGATPWQKLLAAPAEFWLSRGAPSLSEARRGYHKPYLVLGGCGWHLTYFGGPRVIHEKLVAFAHSEFNGGRFTDIKQISARISNGVHPTHETPLHPRILPEVTPGSRDLKTNLMAPVPRILTENLSSAAFARFRCWFDPLDAHSCTSINELATSSVGHLDEGFTWKSSRSRRILPCNRSTCYAKELLVARRNPRARNISE